ncbi:MAG: M28 family peptidase [Ignavibacteriae bacterium]|nr:M28 family peptidase [Ignavibacteriota bacterium]
MRNLLLAVLLIAVAPSDSKIAKEARTGYDSITGDDLKAHLAFLASDELEGRETTYRGQKIAAKYIASVFQKLGLKAVGDNGTYFQHFDLEVTKISDKSSISTAAKSYQFKKDFLSTTARDTIVKAEVVFVGYMDGKQSEAVLKSAEGKIALGLAPPPDPAEANQPRRGRMPYTPVANALATMVIAEEGSPVGTIAQMVARFGGFLDKGSMRLAGNASAGRPARPLGSLAVAITPEAAIELLKSTGQTIEKLKDQAKNGLKAAVETDATVTIDLKIDREIKQSENVAGLLEGSDPKLKDEYVIFTAHYDHVGIGSDGQVYNGADDDGSGTSTILELAEAFAVNPVKPKRSLVFMTVAGEEKGLLGSSYYVSNPIFPLEKTVTNLNIDMIGRVDEKHEKMKQTDYTYVIGSDKISTELDSLLVEANKESENLALDYEFNDDNDPNQFYRRSDHYNFARNGIPIVFFFTGVHEDYHRPGDDVEKILFDRTAKIGRLVYTLGWKTANMTRQLRKDAKPSVYQ